LTPKRRDDVLHFEGRADVIFTVACLIMVGIGLGSVLVQIYFANT
jgi:hypothetical protein